MKQPKSILTIKQKCMNKEHDRDYHLEYGCTGEQEIKIYDLGDFEYAYGNDTECGLGLFWIDKIGYKIPFKEYEIKKVIDLLKQIVKGDEDECLRVSEILTIKNNLKEDDRVVITRNE